MVFGGNTEHSVRPLQLAKIGDGIYLPLERLITYPCSGTQPNMKGVTACLSVSGAEGEKAGGYLSPRRFPAFAMGCVSMQRRYLILWYRAGK
jgi:hypothetical protein